MAPNKSADMKNIVKEALKELLCDDEFLNKLLSKMENKITQLEEEAAKNADKMKQLEGRIESMQQAAKINNICVYNLKEETNENLSGKILDLLNCKMKTQITRDDVVRCYRIGESGQKPRPVIIKFDKFQNKLNVLKNTSKLKGTKIGITEDLSKHRLNLYREATKKYDRKQMFTRFGNIFIRLDENTIKRISSSEDI